MSEGLTQDNTQPQEVAEEDDIEIVIEGEDSESQEQVPEEAKQFLKPTMKNKTQKRIVGLVNKSKEKDSEIEDLKNRIQDLQNKESARTNKEISYEHENTLSAFQKQQQLAMEEGRFDEASKLNADMLSYVQQNPSNSTSQNFNPEDYFKQNNSWYGVDPQKTASAKGISSEIYSDQQFKNWTEEQKLDEVSRRVTQMFQQNEYRNASPTEGITNQRPSSRQVVVTQQDINDLKKIYTHKSHQEILEIAKKNAKAFKLKETIDG